MDFEQENLNIGENYHYVTAGEAAGSYAAYAVGLNPSDSYKFHTRYDRPDGSGRHGFLMSVT
jgi:hypothetical protein